MYADWIACCCPPLSKSKQVLLKLACYSIANHRSEFAYCVKAPQRTSGFEDR
jgi:hypothetical protein